MDNLILVATQVGVLFALMAVGFVCRKVKMLTTESVKGIVDILVVIVTPAIVIQAFQRPFDAGMLKGLGFTACAALLGHAVAIVCSYLLIHHPKAHTKNVLRVSAVFSNAGFMGIPLTQALLGDVGVFYSVVYVGIFNVVIWSWGLCTVKNISTKQLMGPEIKSMFLNPGTVGLALGLPLFFTSTQLPTVLATPVRLLSDLNTPLAMLIIGYYLCGAKPGPVLRSAAAYVASAFRLLAYPLAVIGVLCLLRDVLSLDRSMMLALVVSSAAPTAALTSRFAARYGSDVDMSVGMVSGTTLVSIVTMPPVIAFAMSVL